MGQYNFVNPGSAVADRVEDVLTKQKDEQRRAMLDELARRQAESGMALQADSLKTSALQRETMGIAQDTARLGLEDARYKQATGDLLPGDDISGLDQELQDAIARRGGMGPNPTGPKAQPMSDERQATLSDIHRLQQEVGASPETMRGVSNYAQGLPQGDSGKYFQGSKAEREEAQVRGRLEALIERQKDPSLRSMMDFYNATGAKTIPASIGNLFQPREQVGVYDEESDKYRGLTNDETGEPVMGAPGAARTVFQRSRPPRAPQGPAPQYFSFSDPNQAPTWIKPGEKIPPGARRGNQPTGSSAGRVNVPPPIAALMTKFAAESMVPGGLPFFGGTADPQKEEGFRQAQQNVIHYYNTTPDVKDVVRQILVNDVPKPDPKNPKVIIPAPTTQQIISNYQPDFENEAEFSQFADLLSWVRGQ